jgi:ribosomal protein S18 acetylase RimI-like enzyme
MIPREQGMITIRKAETKDVAEMHRLGRAVAEFSVNEETVTFWPEDILTRAVGSHDTSILVAEAGQEIVGFIIANLNVSLRKAIIENVYVRPDKRDAGIGGRLLDELLALLRRTPIAYVSTLIPLHADSALRLYGEAGFSKGESFLWLDKSLSGSFKRYV